MRRFVPFLVLLLTPALAVAAPKLDTSGTQERDVVFVRHGARALSVHLLRPLPLPKTTLPVVLYFHGGAWRNGSYQKMSPTLIALARAGVAVASVEFRASDEATFPAPLEDARAAVRWVKEQGAGYSLDAKRLGVYGLSTGGLFAGLLAYSGSSARAACLQSAPSDLNTLRGARLDWQAPDSPLAAMMGVPLSNHGALERASPLFYADEDAPPTLLLAGAQDTFINPAQSEALYEKLKRAGARVEYQVFEGQNHDLRDAQDDVTHAVVAFFGRELAPKTPHSKP